MSSQTTRSVSPALRRLSSGRNVSSVAGQGIQKSAVSRGSQRTCTRTASPSQYHSSTDGCTSHYSTGSRSVCSGTKNSSRMHRKFSPSTRSVLTESPATEHSSKSSKTFSDAEVIWQGPGWGGFHITNGKLCHSGLSHSVRSLDVISRTPTQSRTSSSRASPTKIDQTTRGSAATDIPCKLAQSAKEASDLLLSPRPSSRAVNVPPSNSPSPCRRPIRSTRSEGGQLPGEEQPQAFLTGVMQFPDTPTQRQPSLENGLSAVDFPRRIKEAQRAAELASQETASIWHYFELQQSREGLVASRRYEKQILSLQKMLEELEHQGNVQQKMDQQRVSELRQEWAKEKGAWVEMEETMTEELRAAEQELASLRMSLHASQKTDVQVKMQVGTEEPHALRKRLADNQAVEQEVVRELHRVHDQLESVRAAAASAAVGDEAEFKSQEETSLLPLPEIANNQSQLI